MQNVDKAKVNELKKIIREAVDLIDSMDDATYDAVNDYTALDYGRYSDLIEFLQHLHSIK